MHARRYSRAGLRGSLPELHEFGVEVLCHPEAEVGSSLLQPVHIHLLRRPCRRGCVAGAVSEGQHTKQSPTPPPGPCLQPTCLRRSSSLQDPTSIPEVAGQAVFLALVDLSGGEDYLELVRGALQAALEALPSTALFGLITFADQVCRHRHACSCTPHTKVAPSRETLPAPSRSPCAWCQHLQACQKLRHTMLVQGAAW